MNLRMLPAALVIVAAPLTMAAECGEGASPSEEKATQKEVEVNDICSEIGGFAIDKNTKQPVQCYRKTRDGAGDDIFARWHYV